MKLFLTMTFAIFSILASAQFVAITTIDQPEEGTNWEMSNITNNLGIGYQVNDKMTLGIVKNGDETDLWGRYKINFLYLSVQATTEKMTENLSFGVGYSLRAWKNLYIEPNYVMYMREDSEAELKVGLSYKF
tara:strand:- start:301 stop:696 length:396 start_codon:yes stop_codon:yes gene_type:complete